LKQNLDKFQQKCYVWSAATFGVRDCSGPLNHLKSEIEEVKAKPDDLTEWADCYLLLSDAAARAGIKMSAVFEAAMNKHEINVRRDWPPVGETNEQGFTEHKK